MPAVWLVLLFLVSAVPGARAQFDARFSQYWDVPAYYHPASAGRSETLNVYGAYGMQLMGFTHAPRVMCFGADLPFSLFGKQQGVGMGFFNEGIGLFRNQRFWVQYAYVFTIGKGRLGVGVQAGALNVSFDPTDINLGDETEDEAFPTTEEHGMAADVGAGVYYSHPKFFAGLSAQHLTSPRIAIGENSSLRIQPSLYLTGGYNIQTRNPLISIQPSCHLQTDFTSMRLDLTGRLFYTWRSKTFSGGIGYSPDTSVTFNFGLKVRSLTVGYAYELFTSGIGPGSGSHDIVVNYAFDLSRFGRDRGLHKSIRIL